VLPRRTPHQIDCHAFPGSASTLMFPAWQVVSILHTWFRWFAVGGGMFSPPCTRLEGTFRKRDSYSPSQTASLLPLSRDLILPFLRHLGVRWSDELLPLLIRPWHLLYPLLQLKFSVVLHSTDESSLLGTPPSNFSNSWNWQVSEVTPAKLNLQAALPSLVVSFSFSPLVP